MIKLFYNKFGCLNGKSTYLYNNIRDNLITQGFYFGFLSGRLRPCRTFFVLVRHFNEFAIRSWACSSPFLSKNLVLNGRMIKYNRLTMPVSWFRAQSKKKSVEGQSKEMVRDFVLEPSSLQENLSNSKGVFALAVGFDRHFAKQIRNNIEAFSYFQPFNLSDLLANAGAKNLIKRLPRSVLNEIILSYVEGDIFQFNPLIFHYSWLQLFFVQPWWKRLWQKRRVASKVVPFSFFTREETIYLVAPLARPDGAAFLNTQQQRSELDRDDELLYHFFEENIYLYGLSMRWGRLQSLATFAQFQFWPESHVRHFFFSILIVLSIVEFIQLMQWIV